MGRAKILKREGEGQEVGKLGGEGQKVLELDGGPEGRGARGRAREVG